MTGPGEMRISHADRDRVVEVLRNAAGEGRLDLDELDERLEATYAAKTYADLVPITIDLPGHGPIRQQPPAPLHRPPPAAPMPWSPGPWPTGGLPHVPVPVRLQATLSGVERRGEWIVPNELVVACVLGSARLDFRQARFTARETVVTVNAIMGGAEIIVGAGTQVVVEGTGVMGAFAGPSGRVAAELTPDSPVLRVRGFALMGSVEVKRKRPPGDLRRRLTGY